MTNYKTPGVYIQEVSTFPPSVAAVETAIPAFIGYTEKADKNGINLHKIPTSVASLVEYEQLFGGASPLDISEVNLDVNNRVENASLNNNFLLYDSLRMFYANGGGRCYIISIGNYSDTTSKDKADFIGGLAELEKKDEPTIILFPDAVLLKSDDLYDIQKEALKQCDKLKDRFVVMDLLQEKTASPSFSWADSYDDFRDKIGVNYLKYGAAYTPYLETSLNKKITYRDLNGKLKKLGLTAGLNTLTSDINVLNVIASLENIISNSDDYKGVIGTYTGSAASIEEMYLVKSNAFKTEAGNASATLADVRGKFIDLYKFIYDTVDALIDNESENTAYSAEFTDILKSTIVNLQGIINKLNTYNENMNALINGAAGTTNQLYNPASNWASTSWGSTFTSVTADNSIYVGANPKERMIAAEPKITAIFKVVNSAIEDIISQAEQLEENAERSLVTLSSTYRNILVGLQNICTTMPPSGAIAGVYAAVDGSRGVWKAPANVSLNLVKGLTETITEEEQRNLNVDVVAGKSINAIRAFTGKGMLVWGARTLAGNDNEWRYVSVRRFFNMAEESIKKATAQFVFESNDANTWVKVRAMVENFLILQWRAGALAGAKPEDAFYVRVGLNETMTADDVLNGLMIVEIGMAVVRPAEFIILRFSHKLQVS